VLLTGPPGRRNISSKYAQQLQQLSGPVPRQSTYTENKKLNLPRSKFHDVAVHKMLGDRLVPTSAVAQQVDGSRHKEEFRGKMLDTVENKESKMSTVSPTEMVTF